MRWLALAAVLFLVGCGQDRACPPVQGEPPKVAADANWEPQLEDLVGFDYGEAWLAPYFVYGVSLALPGAVMLWLLGSLLVMRRKATVARRASREARSVELKAGEACVHGAVAAIDEKAAVRLEVEQVGVTFNASSNKSSSAPSYKTRWTEVGRRLLVHPFLVRTSAGDVRVEPDEGTFLIDDLEAQPRNGSTRLCVAELTAGEEVYAMGRLEEAADPQAGGYRGGGRTWVLRPPGDGHLRLSTKPLTESYAHHAANRLLALGFLALLVLVAQLLVIPYHLAVAKSVNEAAVVVARCDFPGEDEHYHYVTYRLLSGGKQTETRVNAEDHARLPVGTVVPANVSRWGEDARVTLGVGASPLVAPVLIPMVLLVLASILVPRAVLRSRTWWERDRIEHVVDGELDEQP